MTVIVKQHVLSWRHTILMSHELTSCEVAHMHVVMSRYLMWAGLHAVSRVLSQEIDMECWSSTSSSDYEENLENVCAILAVDTVTVRREVWVHDINMKWMEKGEFHHLLNP